MRLHAAARRALVLALLLASGCLDYEDFRAEEQRLTCEIRLACGLQSSTCEDLEEIPEMDDCERFNRREAERCLEALEDVRARIGRDPEACDWSWADIDACAAAVARRQFGDCLVSP